MRRLAIFLVALAGCCAAPQPTPPSRFVVHGTLKFEGIPPKRKLLRTDGVPGNPLGGILRDDLVVDAENNVRWAFVFVKKGLEGTTWKSPPTPVVLNQAGFMYEPHVLGVQVGQPIHVQNEDQVLHSPHPLPMVNPEFGRAMPILTELRFSRPEIMVSMRCDVHPWMRAWIGVVEHPFFAVTDASGKFELRNLPAGKYRIGVWHERLTIEDQEIVVNEDLGVDLVGRLK